MPKKPTIAAQPLEADLDTLVKIEFETINGKPYYGQVTEDELLYVWVKVFGRNKDELFGFTSTKTLSRNVRAIYKLKEPIKLSDVTNSPGFFYEKYLDDGSVEEITGRFIGYGAQKPAEIGDTVKVTAKTNFGVEAAGVLAWLKLYGTPTSNFGFLDQPNNPGFKTDIFEAELILKQHIEEYLPIYGQKVQISYPGMPKQCNRCYLVGHLRRECCNKRKDWIAYVTDLISNNDAITEEMVGSWKNAINRWKNSNANAEASGSTTQGAVRETPVRGSARF